MMVLTSWVYFH